MFGLKQEIDLTNNSQTRGTFEHDHYYAFTFNNENEQSWIQR